MISKYFTNLNPKFKGFNVETISIIKSLIFVRSHTYYCTYFIIK